MNELCIKILIGTALSSWLTIAIAEPINANTAIANSSTVSEEEVTSFGCVLGGISLIGAAYWAGPSEAIMLWGGGLLTPSGSGVLAASIIGGLGAAGCSIGATIAPTLTWAYQQF